MRPRGLFLAFEWPVHCLASNRCSGAYTNTLPTREPFMVWYSDLLMPAPDHSDLAVIRFGPFELETKSGELRKRGIRLKLTHQACRVLCALLDAPGEVVTRDHLRWLVWPDQKSHRFR